MFEIDHVPIGHRDLDRLASAFEALGFTVSRVCRYESPDQPDEAWTCRAVFLQHGWLDLQAHPDAPPDRAATPHGCLFRAPSPGEAASGLPAFRTGPPERLVRRWPDDEAPPLPLTWMSLRERIAPLVLALVEYAGADASQGLGRPHPNTAHRLLGLAFGGAAPGPGAQAAAAWLALSGFRYLPEPRFAERFGACDGPQVALRFGVASLDAAIACLRAAGVPFHLWEGALTVPAHGPLRCGVEFALTSG